MPRQEREVPNLCQSHSHASGAALHPSYRENKYRLYILMGTLTMVLTVPPEGYHNNYCTMRYRKKRYTYAMDGVADRVDI